MRVLIAGCGYVGEALGRRLAARGHRAFGLRRRADALPGGIEPVAADLTDPATLRGLPGGLDAVVYAASAGGGGDDAYRAAYVDGVRHLLAALPAGAAAPPFAFVSSSGVYAQRDGAWVDEDSEVATDDPRARRLLAGEALALAAPGGGSVVRFSGIYGPGRTGLLGRVARGEATVSPEPRFTNRIHRDDCAGVLAHWLAVRPRPRVWLASDDEPATDREVIGWLARELGAPPPREAAPAPGSRAARGNRRCANARLRASGYAFAFPTFRDGYAPLLDAFRRRSGQRPD